MVKRQPSIKSSTNKDDFTTDITTPKIKNSSDTINENAEIVFQQANGWFQVSKLYCKGGYYA